MKFLIKIFSPVILIISFLLLIYIFYRSEIFWGGNIRDYYKIYYLISSLLILFSVISFFFNDKIKQYLIISTISLLVSLYLFEGYTTYKIHISKKQLSKNQLLKEQLYEKQTGNKWDRRQKEEIYRDKKKNNNKITVSFLPRYLINRNYSKFPLSGLSDSETIHCNENGYYSIYRSDRYGFNNPDTEWDKKEVEYVLVGDSFVHGACINRPNDISSVLRKLSNKSVLNLGFSGNGPLIEYATLREYLNTNAKKVLWFYYESNDLINLKNEKKNKILINYLKNLNFSQNLKLTQDENDKMIIKLIEELERNNSKFNLIKFIKFFNTRNLITPRSETLEASTPFELVEFEKILKLTKRLTNKNNSKFFFIYLPDYNRYIQKYDNTNYNLVKNIVNDLNIPFIDIHKEVFKSEENPLKLFPFEMGGHYNVKGYKKVAEKIYEFTKD